MNFPDKIKARNVNNALQRSDLSSEDKLTLYQRAFDRMAQRVRNDRSIDPRRKEQVARMIEEELKEIAVQRINHNGR